MGRILGEPTVHAAPTGRPRGGTGGNEANPRVTHEEHGAPTERYGRQRGESSGAPQGAARAAMWRILGRSIQLLFSEPSKNP